MIHAIIFDLGNTLMHFQGDWNVVTPRGVEQLIGYLHGRGLMVGDGFAADFLKHRREGRGLSARTDVEYTASQAVRDTLAQHGHADVPDAVISEAVERFFGPEQECWVAYPDARQTLAQLHARGLRFGVISNATDDPFIQRIVRQAELDFLDPVISSAGVPWRKPDPRIFQHVLDIWQLKPQEVLMVGDWAGTDILGAHHAGMRGILIDADLPPEPHLSGQIPDEQLLEPDAVIHNLTELIDVYDHFNSKE